MVHRRLLVIIPAYNEGGSIARTIEEIRSLSLEGVSVDTVVIDDGSTDNTRQEAVACDCEVVSLPFNLGIGGAVQTGFQYAKRYGYDFAAQVDGDGQHDPKYLASVLKPVISGEVDICCGSRFIEAHSEYRSSFVRRIGIHFFAYLISFLTRASVTDPTSGFRVFSKRAVQVFAGDYPTDFPEPESIVLAKRLGLVFCEKPVQMRKRTTGHSSIRYLTTLYYMIKVTCAILLMMIKKKERVR